ncbi:hypothetical protein [Oceanicoccus sp. KOV_DT_Chl]|uniref:hypothetical protein n=1 Tax=Oceanicoccus sp. KOV_DT_Chl TaxID=1904639 RepID=UPI000C7C66B5|nr:hypothetical protein [Oceanicoccus sp. KOV_DT_Chl]
MNHKMYPSLGLFWWQLIAVFSICLLSVSAHAVEQKASASVDYGFFLNAEQRSEAELIAQQKAIELWIVEKQPSQYKNYEKVKNDIDANIGDYILEYIVLDTEKKNKKYTVVIRANINEPKLQAKLLQPSNQATAGANALLSFIFVAREQVGKVSQSDKESSQTKSQNQEISKIRNDDNAGQAKSQTQTVGVKERSTQYNDKAIWEVSTTTEIDTAMGDVFTEAGYLVIDAAILEDESGKMLSVSAFINDYKNGSDISPATRKEAIQGMRALADPVEYLALGTLDIDEQIIDPKTGNIKIAVSITGQVLSMKYRGAAVAKVGPQVTFGEGPTVLVAKNNALKNAATLVAQKLVAKLSARNIR